VAAIEGLHGAVITGGLSGRMVRMHIGMLSARVIHLVRHGVMIARLPVVHLAEPGVVIGA
jgi:hypothetical protein